MLGLISFWLGQENTAGSIRTTDAEKKKMAAMSLQFNFKQGVRFEKLFGDWFDTLGIDRVTQTWKGMPKPAADTKPEEETKEQPKPVVVKPPYKQVMTFEEFEKFLAELDGNGEHRIMLMDFISLGGIAGFDDRVQKIMLE